MEGGAVDIVLNTVIGSGGATKYALVQTSRDATCHSADGHPTVAPRAQSRSMDAGLSEFPYNFADSQKAFSFGLRGLFGPS